MKGIPYALFTGAGFSKDWGGLLAEEMTFRILSSPDLEGFQKIKEDLLCCRNYETVLQSYREQHPARDRNSATKSESDLTCAIIEAFNFQDRVQQTTDLSRPSLSRLVRHFVTPALREGFAFFTLNQDLLIERLWPATFQGAPTLRCPGIEQRVTLGTVSCPPVETVSTFNYPDSGNRSTVDYFKLHGSYNWTERFDGTWSRVFLAGGKKVEQAQAMGGTGGSLLQHYLRHFDEGVQAGTTILVIGYSFSDEHINKVLARPGVRVFVIDPRPFPTDSDEWYSHYRSPSDGGRFPMTRGDSQVLSGLVKNIEGYWLAGFKGVFGLDHSDSQADVRSQDLCSTCIGLPLLRV